MALPASELQGGLTLTVFDVQDDHGKMHRPPTYRRRAWRKKEPPPPGLTAKEGLVLVVLGIGAIVGIALLLHFFSVWRVRQEREETLEEMRRKYALTEEQLISIQKIENEHHGSGGIFPAPSHAPEDSSAHLVTISQQMSGEAAARFLADRQTNHQSFQKAAEPFGKPNNQRTNP